MSDLGWLDGRKKTSFYRPVSVAVTSMLVLVGYRVMTAALTLHDEQLADAYLAAA